MVENYILAFVFGGLFYGWFLAMLHATNRIHKKWFYTIPIWPLALLVVLICVILRGLEVLIEAVGL